MKKKTSLPKGLIIDTCCWSLVFNANNVNHSDFIPVKDSIDKKKRILHWGGTEYRKELSKSESYRKLHIEYSKIGKARQLPLKEVDSALVKIRKIAGEIKLQDAHLISIEVVGKAGLIVTTDSRCHESLKTRELYSGKVPKIYSNRKHVHLLI